MGKQIKFGVILTYISTFINIIAGLLITPITLRLFGQAEYGLYTLAMSVMGMLFLFDFGFSNAIVKYVSQFKERDNKKDFENINAMFLILYTIIGVIAFSFGMFAATGADKIFSNGLTLEEIDKFKIMLQIVAVTLGISFPLKLFNGIIIAHEKFIFNKLITVVRFITNPIITVTILFMGFSSIGVLIAISIVNFLLSLIDVYYCFVILKTKIKLHKFDFKLMKEISMYSLWVFIASLADFIYSRTDMFILGALVNTAAVAIYNVAEVINGLYTKLTMVLSGFFLPRLVQMVSKNVSNHELTNMFIKVSRIQFLLAALVLTGFALVGNEFIVIWAGVDYVLAYWVALLVMSSRFIPVVQVLATSILQAKNKHAFQSKLYLGVAILNLAISIPLALTYGVIGVAIGTLIGKIINTIVMNFNYAKVGIEMKRYFKEVFVLFIPMTLVFIIGVILKRILSVTTWFDILVFSLLLTAFYGGIMFRYFMNRSEKDMLVKPLKRMVLRKAS
ncbi:oligosaccharide flippase family protein [Paraliobacillus zengyii]|uniref:oligosaccharide flippase family protein n=1 Tax=Paraliobacillus zengyii TaxID=2213194 RepID=UPI000E3C7EAA|nr:oligosaccharide flippase family protein [Paraliobacillus zengyii]